MRDKNKSWRRILFIFIKSKAALYLWQEVYYYYMNRRLPLSIRWYPVLIVVMGQYVLSIALKCKSIISANKFSNSEGSRGGGGMYVLILTVSSFRCSARILRQQVSKVPNCQLKTQMPFTKTQSPNCIQYLRKLQQ